MPFLHTCQTCAADVKACPARARLLEVLQGSGVTSLTHRCADFSPRFTPGAAVEVLTVAFMGANPYDEGPPPRGWFPGHFVRYSGSKAIAYIKPGSLSEEWAEDYPFESDRGGIVKVPQSRIRPSTWAPPICADQCRECGAEPGLGQPCTRDPIYGRLTHCLAAKLSTGSAEPAAHGQSCPGMNQNEVSPDPDDPLAGPKARPRPNAEPSAA